MGRVSNTGVVDIFTFSQIPVPGGGALTLEKGIGMCRAEDPLFHPLLLALMTPFLACFSSQDPQFD